VPLPSVKLSCSRVETYLETFYEKNIFQEGGRVPGINLLNTRHTFGVYRLPQFFVLFTTDPKRPEGMYNATMHAGWELIKP
jgi:hypothetical protein